MHMIPSPVLKGGIPGQIACYAACKKATLSFTDWWFVGVRHNLRSPGPHVSCVILSMVVIILLVGWLHLPDTRFFIIKRSGH